MYHILVKLKNKKSYEEYDLEKKEKDILNDYIIPYLKNEEFFIGSNFVKKEDIIDFLIKKTDAKIENYRQELEWRRNSSGVVYLYPVYKSVTLQNQITGENIVGDLIKQAKEKEEFSKDKDEITLNKSNNKVFIVHGHDVEMRETVARFVEKIGLEAVILYEQTNGGKTIIEKIEENTDVRYGIVLYSPCDHGKSQKEEKLKNRPRQNVVLEHGYLMAKLGRKNVIALTKGELELPSDLLGIINPNYDLSGYWKFKIAMELKENGLEIDMNKIG